MGKQSSAKKVARAARAGGSRNRGQRRQIGFPLACAAIIIVGISLILVARGQRQAQAQPKTNQDHWHAAYGVYLCDHFVSPLTDAGADTLGIHTHGDGIIHIHPFVDGAAGTNAKIGLFYQDTNLSVSDKKIAVPGGDTVQEGKDKCNGKSAIVEVAKWTHAEDAAAGKKPTQIFTTKLGDIRFTNDRMAFTIAFLPEGAKVPAPTSIPTLDQLTDVPGASTTTVPGETTSSTAPGDTSSIPSTTPTTAATTSTSKP
jgi:hypothetical protein